jgi:hypothetical protein
LDGFLNIETEILGNVEAEQKLRQRETEVISIHVDESNEKRG